MIISNVRLEGEQEKTIDLSNASVVGGFADSNSGGIATVVDGTIVMTQMMYRAQELGIGSLIVGMYKEKELREQFRIPDYYEIASLLLLGYPAEDCQPHPQLHDSRKMLEETVSYGNF